MSRNRQNNTIVDCSKESSEHISNSMEGMAKLNLGVYMLENPQTPEAASERISIARKLCLRNAQVCSLANQKSKADTWILLAQTIETIFTFGMNETDGWGGSDDALTTSIVEQILRFYEVQGNITQS